MQGTENMVCLQMKLVTVTLLQMVNLVYIYNSIYVPATHYNKTKTRQMLTSASDTSEH